MTKTTTGKTEVILNIFFLIYYNVSE